MIRKIDWESQIGRRLRLRDLHVFAIVAQHGNMAKAAAELRVSQPTVSEVIANLEHALGVRLLDRSRRGVEPTIYGKTLLKRGRAAFDELKQGIREIEFLMDATAGDIRIGSPESISLTLISPTIQKFVRQYPRVNIHVFSSNTPTLDLPQLRNRTLDLVLARSPVPQVDARAAEILEVENLFNDELVVAAGARNSWTRRRKVDLADLVDEPWALTPTGAAIYNHVTNAFLARGLNIPTVIVGVQSVALRGDLLRTGRFVSALPMSIFNLYAKQFPMKILPISLPVRPWPVLLVTLKNRTLSPVVTRFIECVREVSKAVVSERQPRNP